MEPRDLCTDVFTAPLNHEKLPAEEVQAGNPTTGVVDLGSLGSATVGIWEMTEGVARDTEVDEIFIVLAGAGTVTFEDGTTLALHRGTAVRLHAGEQTIWTITEPLRKIFLTID